MGKVVGINWYEITFWAIILVLMIGWGSLDGVCG